MLKNNGYNLKVINLLEMDKSDCYNPFSYSREETDAVSYTHLAAKANTLGFIDAPMLKNEAAKWNKFQSEIERTYLRPNQSEMKWQ